MSGTAGKRERGTDLICAEVPAGLNREALPRYKRLQQGFPTWLSDSYGGSLAALSAWGTRSFLTI